MDGGRSATRVVVVVGNPRPGSRTRRVASALGEALATVSGAAPPEIVDLSALGGRVLDSADVDAIAATETVLGADLIVVASPTYKATYTGLLKAFLDRFETGAFTQAPVVPVLVGAAPVHRLAVDVHLTPLLLELGASVPARGLFVLDSDVEAAVEEVQRWAEQHAPALLATAAARG